LKRLKKEKRKKTQRQEFNKKLAGFELKKGDFTELTEKEFYKLQKGSLRNKENSFFCSAPVSWGLYLFCYREKDKYFARCEVLKEEN